MEVGAACGVRRVLPPPLSALPAPLVFIFGGVTPRELENGMMGRFIFFVFSIIFFVKSLLIVLSFPVAVRFFFFYFSCSGLFLFSFFFLLSLWGVRCMNSTRSGTYSSSRPLSGETHTAVTAWVLQLVWSGFPLKWAFWRLTGGNLDVYYRR